MSEKDSYNPDKKQFWKGLGWLAALVIGAEVLLDI